MLRSGNEWAGLLCVWIRKILQGYVDDRKTSSGWVCVGVRMDLNWRNIKDESEEWNGARHRRLSQWRCLRVLGGTDSDSFLQQAVRILFPFAASAFSCLRCRRVTYWGSVHVPFRALEVGRQPIICSWSGQGSVSAPRLLTDSGDPGGVRVQRNVPLSF